MLLTVRSIEMRNFMTHRDEKVKFPSQGIILLWGPSGAGKSSLLDAVGFALFGVNATRASSLDELRHESYPDEDFGVRVSFDVGERKTVQVFRGVERGKTVVWMVDPEGTMTEGARAVQQKVDDLMGGMDAATFFATYFSQQGELDALVKMPGGGRRKFVQRMMGITLLDKVSTRVNKELLRASERITVLDESMPSQSKQELVDAQESARSALASAEERVVEQQTELEAVRSAGIGLATKLKEQDAQADRANQLTPQLQTAQDVTLPAQQGEVDRLRAAVTDAEQAAARVASDAGERARLAELQAEAERLSAAEGALAALDRLRSEAEQAAATSRQLGEDVAALPELPSAIDFTELEERLAAARSEADVLDAQRREAEANLARLEQDSECFTCQRPIDDPERILGDLKRKLSQLNENLTAAKQRAADAQQQLADARATEQARQREAERHRHVRQAAEQAARTADEAAARLDAAQRQAQGGDSERLRAVRRQLSEAAEKAASLAADERLAAQHSSLAAQLRTAESNLSNTARQITAMRTELSELAYDAQAHRQLREQTDEARNRYVRLRDQLAGTREEIQRCAALLAEAEKLAVKYDQIVEDRKKAAARHTTLTRLQQSMKDFKSHMIGQIRPTLEAKTSEHLTNITEGAMPAVAIDEEYNLSIKRPEGGYRRIGLCSGGEQARAAFALRLALTQLVAKRTDTPVGFVSYDEIFGSQDEAHRRGLLESLRYLKSSFPQVFLISHENDLRESDMIDLVVDVPDSGSVGRIHVSSR